MSSTPNRPADGKLADSVTEASDETAKIVREFMKDFVVRPAVASRAKREKVARAWREAALTGR